MMKTEYICDRCKAVFAEYEKLKKIGYGVFNSISGFPSFKTEA